MRYKLEPWLERILSPVQLVFPDGSRKDYKNGADAVSADFNCKYIAETIKAENNIVIISFKVAREPDVSFF